MSYANQLIDFVNDLGAMQPPGAPRLARLIGSPKQTIYAWRSKPVRDASAHGILLRTKDTLERKARDMACDKRASALSLLEAINLRIDAERIKERSNEKS